MMQDLRGCYEPWTVCGLTIMAEAALTVALLAVAGVLLWLALRLQSALAQTRELRLLVAKLTARVWELEQRGVSPVAPAPVSDLTPVPVPGAVPPVRRDWESLVGANWLNRLGALMLVIGIVLFIGYSLTQLGPAGKIAVGALTGFTLLGAGVALEPRAAWRTYSWSLTAAGWAVVYFVTYAAHGLPAARIIEDPAVGTVLLLLVSGAMIAHSVAYRSEPATALAYLLGFVGLNVSPVTGFSVVASLILAVSLLVLAHLFSWFRLPLLGSALVYLTFTVRYDPAVHSQAVLWIYWVAFETWDLLRGRQRSLFLVNLAGFAGASLLHGTRTNVGDWLPLCGAAAVAYLVSAVVRRWTAPEESPAEGGYEWAATAAALFLGGGLADRFTGSTLTFALLFEAELVVLTGRTLRSRWLENAGSALLIAPLIHLAFDASQGREWTPAGIALAAVLLLNRWLLGRGWYFTGMAAILLAFVGQDLLPERWIAPAIAVAGALAIRIPLRDFRWTGIFLLGVAWVGAMVRNVQDLDTIGTAMVVAALYSATWEPVRIAATLLVTVFLYNKVPPRLLSLAWGGEAAALLAAGFLRTDRILRLSALAIFLLCLLRLFVFDLRGLDTPSRILSFIVLGLVLLGASFVYTKKLR